MKTGVEIGPGLATMTLWRLEIIQKVISTEGEGGGCVGVYKTQGKSMKKYHGIMTLI